MVDSEDRGAMVATESVDIESAESVYYPKKKRDRTRGWVPAFLNALVSYPHVTRAAEAAGVTRNAVYGLMRADPDFRAAVDKAYEDGALLLQDLAVERVTEGIERPIYQKGQVVGTYVEYPERLHLALLSAHNARFRQGSGASNGPSSINVAIQFAGQPAPMLASNSQAASTTSESAPVEGEFSQIETNDSNEPSVSVNVTGDIAE